MLRQAQHELFSHGPTDFFRFIGCLNVGQR
jgi:hypothetical protein